MPSSFIRKHVRGLLRNKFGPSTSIDQDNQDIEEEEATTPRGENSGFNDFFGGIDTTKYEFPEVYFGKTGLDLPSIQLEQLDSEVFASYTGPNGGLTQVGEIRAHQPARMANIDDEMSLSIGGTTDDEAEDEEDLDGPISMSLKRSSRNSLLLGSCSSLLGPNGENDSNFGKISADNYDWTAHNTESAFGISVSLYEKNPITGVNAGEPVADVWGVVGRANNGIMALADGVNWGEGSRLAARCAIRGAIDHLNSRVIQNVLPSTTEVFHELLGAFHSAHSLILQEGGMLTTLCVALVAPVKCGNGWALCVCNVGDSLCFVYNRNYGVREVTLGSHDIDQMRDMRDAGGALGPVDGRNPQLHNLTCSMTFVETGDIVFITSDGVSDNFDPVVGKFCVIKKTEAENKENSKLPPREDRTIDVSTRDSSKNQEYARNRTCAASLPCVDATRRHELMLVRMRDVIANGLNPQPNTPTSPRRRIEYPAVSASVLCQRLIQFATQLSQAKRRVLENPELYKKEKMTKAEQRARRKMVREKIADMPGKLDHASVVAYHVSRNEQIDSKSPELRNLQNTKTNDFEEISTISSNAKFENFTRVSTAQCSGTFYEFASEKISISLKAASPPSPMRTKPEQLTLFDIVDKSEKNNNSIPPKPIVERPMSPYEQIPISSRENGKRRKKHARGSIGRHTLGVDVQWLKKLVSKKDESAKTENEVEELSGDATMSNGDRISLRQKLRSMIGSTRNLSINENVNRKI
ncbi:unnamed protein product [Caenorhabditis angaria]|uniref:PPM-type phosphatase domain-containing protein n=1 Tax=Caenorhabditis angaria TaxID=860376 RepID=A0A9P1IEB3_9PELO|nr:unnamed protein product [Caenorhabditis angaria]